MRRGRLAVPFDRPRPDVEEFIAVVKGKPPKRAHFAELFLDRVVMKEISERYLGTPWTDPVPGDRQSAEAWIRCIINVHHRLGYDYIWTGLLAGLVFPGKSRAGADTAGLSMGARVWTEENEGLIASWEDFERYPWPDPASLDLRPYEYLGEHLPEGMGLLACFGEGVFETAMNVIVGYVPLSYMVMDQPDLAAAIFRRIGEIMLGTYRRIIGLRNLRGFFPGDDLGFRTGTLLSPDLLRTHVLGWHKRLAALAHEHRLVYFLHSCGDLSAIMEDLIEDVRIDAKNSFEDAIMPVTEFRRRYRGRVGVLGGVDMGVLCSATEEDLRRRVRGILEECMGNGGYALGSGNTVANYVPVSSYLAMLDEGARWRPAPQRRGDTHAERDA